MFRANFITKLKRSLRARRVMAQFCEACGNSLAADDKFCRNCGRATPGALSVAASTASTATVETSTKAILSLISGLLFFIPFLFIAAIVFGHLALSEIRKSAGRLKGEGIAIAGLVLGYIEIAGIPFILIIAAIAIPNLLRARMTTNESSAVASVRMLNVAEVTYRAAHPAQGYTCSLSDLADALPRKGPLASGQRNGYAFELTGCAPETDGGPNVRYQVVAYPVRVRQTGVRAFCSDESATIKVDSGGSARGCVDGGNLLP
jgi:type IV pilus assembly protein PilA